MNRAKLIPFYGIAIFSLMVSIAIADQQIVGSVSLQQLSSKAINRIAFGSCAKQWQHQAIWDAVLAEKPDIWLFQGDNIFGDTDGATAWFVSKEQMTGEWNLLADKPEFQKARANIPMMATWDNHDYGSHAGGTEFQVKDGTKEAFLTFWGEPEDSHAGNAPVFTMQRFSGHKEKESRSFSLIPITTVVHSNPILSPRKSA